MDTINLNTTSALHMLQFRGTQIIITLGLILSIVGGTSSVSPSGTFTVQTTSKAGVLLYVAAFVALAVTTVLVIPKFAGSGAHTGGERYLAFAVIVALPFIAVRIVYSLLAVFLHDHDFSLIDGSVPIWVAMAVAEEFLVVIFYLAVGWKAEALPATKRGPLTSRPWKGDLNPTSNGGAGQGGRGGRRQGPIHSLVGMAVAAASDRAQGQDVERGAH